MPDKVSTADHLQRLQRDAEEVEERARAAVDGLTPDQLTWNPPEGGWSVVECLEHLSVTNGLYAAKADLVLKRAPRKEPDPKGVFKPGMITARFIRMLQPGHGRYRAPRPFRIDTGGPVGPDAAERFFRAHARIRDLIERMAFVDLTRTKVASPVSSFMRFRIGDMVDVVLVHSKRHVQQAEKVVMHPDFPRVEVTTSTSQEEE